jgi:hypothetical protein
LSTPATAPSESPGAAEPSGTLRALGYLDLAALAFALPVFLVAKFSMLGYAVAAGAWIGQRIVRELVQRRAAKAPDVRTSIGLTAASMIIRGWLVAFAIFAVGLSDSKAGLAAAILFLFLFSIFFTMQAIIRPSGRPAGAVQPPSGHAAGASQPSATPAPPVQRSGP